MNILDSIVTQAAGIAAIRRDIHAHPELCFEEMRTADVVAAKLTEWGIPIHRGMGTTGVVGIVKSGTSVSQLTDKSGNSRHFIQATPANQHSNSTSSRRSHFKKFRISQGGFWTGPAGQTSITSPGLRRGASASPDSRNLAGRACLGRAMLTVVPRPSPLCTDNSPP